MIRKESIGITNVMKLIQNSKPIDWEMLHKLSPPERLEYMNN